MASLDHIIDSVCEASGADFAFVLTRRGRLATKRAPQDMPEAGRNEIVALADAILKQRSAMRHCEMPRQALVPYGGAAPIDVYVAAREEAILVVVMATFTSQNRVGAAMAQGLVDLDALLEMEGSKRSRRRGAAPDAKKSRPPAAKSSRGSLRPPTSGRAKSVSPPPEGLDFDDVGNVRGTVPFMVPLNGGRRPTPPPPPPEITMSEATLGRSTLAAIQVDEEGPDIRYGMAPIGRATVAEIELSMMPVGDPRSSIPDVRVELTSMPEIDVKELELTDRQTLPFTEAAIDTKRAFEAKTDSVVTVADSPNRRVLHGRSAGSLARPPAAQLMPPAPQARKAPAAKDSEKRGQSSKPAGRNSNIELWHRALGELGDDDDDEQTLKDVRPARPIVVAPASSKRKTSIPPAAKSRPQTQAPPAAKSRPTPAPPEPSPTFGRTQRGSRPLTQAPPAAKSSRPPKKK